MDIGTYLQARNETQASFAERVGVHPTTVMRLVKGERVPSGKLLATISAATDGAVGFPDFDWHKPRSAA